MTKSRVRVALTAAALALTGCGEGTKRVDAPDARAPLDGGAPDADPMRRDERPPADGGPGPGVPYHEAACTARLVSVPSDFPVEEAWRFAHLDGRASRATQDVLGDGTDDQVFEFDPAGRPTLLRSFVGAELPWAVTTWTYDALGYLLSQETGDDSGFVTERTSWHYDERGRRVRQDTDQWEEGVAADVDFRTEWLYDARGHLVEERFDQGADGTIDRRAVWTYDADGRRVTEVLHAGGAAVTSGRTWTYDDEGNVVRETDDFDGDGRDDGVIEREFGPAGRLLEERWDADGDGRADQFLVRTYDDAGLLTTETFDDGDGIPEQRIEWSYAAPDRPLRRAIHVTGAPDVEVVEWTYDAAGRLHTQRSSREPAAADTPSATWTWTYDCMP